MVASWLCMQIEICGTLKADRSIISRQASPKLPEQIFGVHVGLQMKERKEKSHCLELKHGQHWNPPKMLTPCPFQYLIKSLMLQFLPVLLLPFWERDFPQQTSWCYNCLQKYNVPPAKRVNMNRPGKYLGWQIKTQDCDNLTISSSPGLYKKQGNQRHRAGVAATEALTNNEIICLKISNAGYCTHVHKTTNQSCRHTFKAHSFPQRVLGTVVNPSEFQFQATLNNLQYADNYLRWEMSF